MQEGMPTQPLVMLLAVCVYEVIMLSLLRLLSSHISIADV